MNKFIISYIKKKIYKRPNDLFIALLIFIYSISFLITDFYCRFTIVHGIYNGNECKLTH